MSSMSGYITYVEYQAGSTKGSTTQGDVFNNPFKLGDVDSTYTGEAVTESFVASQSVVAWTPVVKGVFANGDVKVVKKSDSSILYGTFADGAEKTGTLAGMTFKNEAGETQTYTLAVGDKIAYKYDNIVIPQNDLPMLKAEMKSIPLIAKA